MAKEIDYPPVWLAGFAALGGLIGLIVPISTLVNDYVGAVLVAIGLILMCAAALQMMIARTSVIPRRDPKALIRTGLYRYSRNPIYLADAIVLAGLYVAWDALIALPPVAVFMIIITRRFILGEESRLSPIFGDGSLDYLARTRLWL